MSSATDEKIKDGTKVGGKIEPKSRRVNPVASEVPVSVAGARPATSNEKRELFSEETTTVLVFKDGAVIQLSAAITVGQLLFLTDKRSKREVVCQVVHKRSHRPTSCYVELEFTEEVENFWGVSFPEHEKTTELPPAAEAVEAQETTDDDPSEPIEAPKTEDVAQLKSEVEALRAQLKALQEEKQASQEKKPDEGLDEQSKKLVEAEAAARAAVEASANENAARMDREARERAERMAAKARQHLQAQTQPMAPIQSEVPVETAQTHAPAPSGVDLDAEERAAAEEKEAARRAARVEAEARAAVEDATKLSHWAKDEESRKASEEARKWESEAIEAERRRKQDEQAKRERAERGEPEPEHEPKHEPKHEPEAQQQAEQQKPAVGGLKIGMKLPSVAGSSEAASETGAKGNRESVDPVDELLPKPALDFSRAPKGLDPNDPYNIYKPMRKKAGWVEIVVALLLVLALVGGGGYAWYMNRLPFYHRGPKVEAGPAATKSAPAAKPMVAANGNAAANAAATGGATNSASGAPAATDLSASASANAAGKDASAAAAPAGVAADASTAAKKEAPAQPAEAKAPEAASAEAKAPSKKDSAAKVANGKSGKNRGKAETSSESKPKAETEVDTSDAPVIPAKLVQAVQPVYPPDAMRNYITGDVKIEARVDAKGRIGGMNILVGPAPLRQAAMDALKQYVYEPATQGGKAVASKVTVTIKFWFDP